MSSGSAVQWFWSDWLGDQEVRRLSPAERGVWIDLLALAATGSPFGYVCDGKGRQLTMEEIARVTGETPEVVSNLVAGILDKGAASRDRTGRIYNRRMVRDAAIRLKRSESGKLGGKATANKHWGKSHLLQHLPQHVPRQGSYTPYLKKEDTSSSTTEPRANAAVRYASQQTSKQAAADGQSGLQRIDQMTAPEIAERLAARREADEALAEARRRKLRANGAGP